MRCILQPTIVATWRQRQGLTGGTVARDLHWVCAMGMPDFRMWPTSSGLASAWLHEWRNAIGHHFTAHQAWFLMANCSTWRHALVAVLMLLSGLCIGVDCALRQGLRCREAGAALIACLLAGRLPVATHSEPVTGSHGMKWVKPVLVLPIMLHQRSCKAVVIGSQAAQSASVLQVAHGSLLTLDCTIATARSCLIVG